jgi:MFS family permease
MKQYIGTDIPHLARAGIRTDHIVINLGNTMGRPDDTRADGSMEASDSSSDTSTLYEPNRHDDIWEDQEKSLKTIDDNIELLQSQTQDRRTLNRCAVRDLGTLLGGFLAIAATGGIGNAVGLLQRYWEDNQLKHYSPRDVGWIAGTNLCLSIFVPVIAGPIFDRYGHFWILVIGTLLYALGILSMSILDSHLSEHLVFSCLVLTYGVLCGMGNGLVTMACSGVVCRIFDKRRGLAAGIMSCGNSVGGVGWPMLLRGTFDRWGWSWAIKTMGGIATILLLLGCVLVRAPPLEAVKAKAGLEKPRCCTALGRCMKEGAMCFTKPTFVWMTLSLAVAQFVVMGIVGTLPSWGDEQGFDYDLLFNFVAVMNA